MDANFFRQALAGGEQEIRLSQLALSHSQDPQVRRLAQMMIRDHSQMNAQLTAVSRIGRVPAGDPGAIAQLATLAGPQFDRRYLADMLNDHRDAIAMFQDAARNARTDPARRLAADALPALRGHLSAVQHTVQVVNETPRPR
jgi:putative membrane protein